MRQIRFILRMNLLALHRESCRARVVWLWNPDATNENCTNGKVAKNDGYFLAKNNNQVVIDMMFEAGIQKVANKRNQKKESVGRDF